MAKQIMSDDDHDRVSAAVHAAEGGTAGEIVTIIAPQSGDYMKTAGDVPCAIGIIALSVAGAPLLVQAFDFYVRNKWVERPEPPSYLVAWAIGIAALYLLLRFWSGLRFKLTPRTEKRQAVRAQAVTVFKLTTKQRTGGRTGILIYLSLAERMAEIVADEAIHSKVEPQLWGQAMAKLVGEVKDGRIADGMIAAIGDVGAILAEHFPRAVDDRNELPDRLIEL